MSNQMLACSVGITVKIACVKYLARNSVMAALMSVVCVMGVLLTATMMLLRRVERQPGMRTASVEGMLDFSRMQLLLGCCMRSRPRVGWLPLVVIVVSIDAPKVLEVRSEGIGVSTVVRTTGSPQESSSSGMMLACCAGAKGVVGVVGAGIIGGSTI